MSKSFFVKFGFLSLSIFFTTLRCVGQDVPLTRLIPQNQLSKFDYLTFDMGNTVYGGVVLTKAGGSIFGEDSILSLYTKDNRTLTFYSGTGNIIFFPNINHANTALRGSGNVGIGTTNPLAKLSVNGDIWATEVKVKANIDIPDYVFEPNYKNPTLLEIKEYISNHKHLPEIPSAAEISENGIDLGEMNLKLLKKIEELTLHQIALLEKLNEQQKRIEELEFKVE